MSPGKYADPKALRSAIADRLRPIAKERGIQLTNMQRQFAYDRLLSRVFTADPDRWVLKGGTAMLARIGPEARHTRDVDLLNREGGLRAAERALHVAAGLDLDDFFTFTLAPGRLLTEGVRALRVPVDTRLGVKRFAEFHVDLVAELTMTGRTESVPPLVPADIPGLARTTYIAYPLVDHIADKVCALHETHERASGLREPSSRYRDLADIAVFAHTVTVKARDLKVAIASEATRRGMTLPQRLIVPTDSGWTRGYARVARDAPRLRERDLEAAIATASLFLDPVLDGSAQGHWDHERLRWQTRPHAKSAAA
jgi:hypothetical protein